MFTRRQAVIGGPATLLVGASIFTKAGMAQTNEGTPAPKDVPPEMMAIMEKIAKGFSNKDFELFKSVYASDLVIIDVFPRYRWTGQTATTDYWADIFEFFRKFKVEREEFVLKEILAWGVSGDRGYTSISAVLTIMLKDGKSIVRPGIFALTYAKLDGSWKVDGQSWGRSS